jgi:hypothetical protein
LSYPVWIRAALKNCCRHFIEAGSSNKYKDLSTKVWAPEKNRELKMVFLLNLMRFGFPLTIMIKYGDVNFIALENSLCTDMKFKDLVDEGGDNAAPKPLLRFMR